MGSMGEGGSGGLTTHVGGHTADHPERFLRQWGAPNFGNIANITDTTLDTGAYETQGV